MPRQGRSVSICMIDVCMINVCMIDVYTVTVKLVKRVLCSCDIGKHQQLT